MSKALKTRVDELERLTHLSDGGAHLMFCWMESDEPLYTDMLGDKREHFTLEQVLTLYPKATICDYRELNAWIRIANELRAQDEYAGTSKATWWIKLGELREQLERERDEQTQDVEI